MAYNVLVAPSFARDAKRLKKRYKSFGSDIDALIRSLEENPLQGVDLGGGVHKIRMAITSKGRGKSGGARVIFHANVFLDLQLGTVVLLAVYDKADQDSMADHVIYALLKEYGIV